MASKKRRYNYTKKGLNKHSKSTTYRPMRHKRVLSVSTSFSGTSSDIEQAKKNFDKMHHRTRSNNKSEVFMRNFQMDEEEKANTTTVIKEVESEEEDNE